jgi:Fe2+ transport system protein FeoA
MAGIGNTKEATFTDGSGSGGDVLNIDTVNGIVQVPNNKAVKFYSDAYTTLTGQIINGNYSPPVSSSAPALATSGTITTANVGVARVNPGSAVTAVVLGSGTINGQQVTVVNEAAVSNTIQFAASGSSFVADGTNDIIPGLQMRTFVWDSTLTAWVAEPLTTNGTIDLIQSSTAAALATSGTVTTNGVGIARINPGSAVTACVMGTGTIQGQLCLVINEAAPSFTAQFAASGSSFVADGTNCLIPGGQARLFAWDSAQSLWYEISPLVNGALLPVASPTAPALATSGTVSTSFGVSRVTPGSAVTSCVLAAGTIIGQKVTVINEATGANTINFAASASSFVADGATTAIAGLRCAEYTWDGTNWFHS